MNYLDLIKKEIQNILGEDINFSVEIPELEHGDVTTNVCLIAGKALSKSPIKVAEMLVPKLEKSLSHICSKIDFALPGFLNMHLRSDFVKKNLNTEKSWFSFLKSEDSLESKKYAGKKVLVEFTSINLFKPFTIGHLMSNFTGEYISRALTELGAKVVNISYPSDISIGIAKAIWIIKRDGGLKQEIFKKGEDEIVKYLGESYVRGVNEYKQAEESKDEGKIREVKEIANNLYGNVPSVDLEIYEKTKGINIEYFLHMVHHLGSHFDGFIYESEAGVVGKKIVEANIGKVFQRSEGAVIYTPDESRKDINTSVFINSEGNPTYLAKDIGLLDLKFKKYSPLDYSIYVTDNEQSQHFKSVFDAGGKIKKEWEDKSLHIQHGRMTFKGQKMSSRLGGVPSAEEVINTVLEDVQERSDERIQDLSEEEKNNLQSEIALSALRISILRSKPGVNIDFDPEKASSFEGDSGPYLCYTHARCVSLLEKGKAKRYSPRLDKEADASKIERKVLQFNHVLKTSGEEIAPQKLVKYLFELAGEFNTFYAHEKVLTEDKRTSEHNLYLTNKVMMTLKKGLNILGINAPEKM